MTDINNPRHALISPAPLSAFAYYTRRSAVADRPRDCVSVVSFNSTSERYVVNASQFTLLSRLPVCLSVCNTLELRDFLQTLFTSPDRPWIWVSFKKNIAKIFADGTRQVKGSVQKTFLTKFESISLLYPPRDTLCTLPTFLPPDAMRNCGPCGRAVYVRPAVRSSVCLSITFVYSVEMNKRIFNFSPSDGHSLLVFPYQTLWQYSDGDPLTKALNAGEVGKNCDSQPISGFRIDDWWNAINSTRLTVQ